MRLFSQKRTPTKGIKGMHARLLVGLVLLTAGTTTENRVSAEEATNYGWCNETTYLSTSLPEDERVFGAGTTSASKKNDYYADGTNRCWVLTTPGSAITVVFESLHTEYQHDFVYVLDEEGAKKGEDALVSLTGEVPSPYVVRVAGDQVVVHFKADETFHADPVTLQLGFTAHFFESSDGECVNDCSGHGNCEDGLCDCVDAWGPDGTTDCSIETSFLKQDETVVIKDALVGEWRYFKFRLTETSTFLVELVDWGGPDADPRLMLAADTIPTLSHYLPPFNDWFNWFYDCSDIHYLRGELGPGTYQVGVTNDAFRATESMYANLTLRFGPTSQEMPCLLNCNGHGTCDYTTGDCACDQGWAGSVVNAPDTCQFPITEIEFDTTYSSTVRIGNWDYYQLPTLTEAQADNEQQHTLLVDFYSKSPHAYPIIWLRHSEIPRLDEGFLPTYDAFQADFGDQDGFELVQGQRMSILVNATSLKAGSYFVGVYNIWGHNGAERYNSHDTCSYEWKASLYAAGTPCPSTANGFCDGIAGACDFNTGECQCPEDRLWRDCSFKAASLVPNGPLITVDALEVEAANYYVIDVTKKHIKDGLNLLVTVEALNDGAVPTVLARFGDLPFPNDLSQFDDHDLLSTFYSDSVHEVLLDNQELAQKGPGQWYVAVLNPQESSTSLKYHASAKLQAELDCPRDHNDFSSTTSEETEVCSGKGTCVKSLGRCDCDDGNVMDDCSADGVFRVNPGTFFPWDYLEPLNDDGSPAYDDDTLPWLESVPEIRPDDWVFFSVVVGCESRALRVYFSTTDDGAAPTLVIRKGRLPLMQAATYDYWDYYDGENGHEPTQLIYVTPCGDWTYGCGDSCCVAPHYPGTTFATGAPDPGVYYIGVYNDAQFGGSETIKNYFLRVDVDAAFDADDSTIGGCPSDSDCADGFIGYKCLTTCPGVAPSDVYSNSPTGDDSICGGSGTCSFLGDDDFIETVCECDDAHVGPECDIECPVAHAPGTADDDDEYAIPEVCAGRGTCFGRKLADESWEAACTCDVGYGGPVCLDECDDCGAHGKCVWIGDFAHMCECDDGYVGDECEFVCPGIETTTTAHQKPCSNKGDCVLVHAYDGAPLRASCECDDGRHGDDCSLECPRGSTGLECDGHGVCMPNVDQTSAECQCLSARRGLACESNATVVLEETSSGGSSAGSKGISRGTAAGLALAALVLLGLTIAAVLIAERRKREISRYERLVREVGAQSSTIITAAGATSAEEAPNDVGNYTAPDVGSLTEIGDAPLPDFTEMRNVNTSVNPFHTERVNL